MVAWTSSSGIPVQPYRTDVVAEAMAVRRRWRWRWRGERGGGWRLCGGLHGSLPGQGPAAFYGADHP